MRNAALRFALIALVASVAVAGCAKKKPVGVDSNTSASGVGGFGPGSGAGSAPGGFGAGNTGAFGAGNTGAGGGFAGAGNGSNGQLFRDANGNLIDASGNIVDEFGNPIGGGVGSGGGAFANGGVIDSGAYQPGGNVISTDGNGNYFDANGNPVDQFGNPLGASQSFGQYQQQGGDPFQQGGGQFAQSGGQFGQGGGQFAQGGGQFGQGAGAINFAGDDGSPNYFAQRVGDRVLFDTDSSTIDAEGREILRRQAAWFQQHPQYAITIEGHADERGTRDYNLGLGAKRANATRSVLLSLGIDPNRVRTVSYGKERPVRASSTPGAWRVNRRAVTTLRGGPSS